MENKEKGESKEYLVPLDLLVIPVLKETLEFLVPLVNLELLVLLDREGLLVLRVYKDFQGLLESLASWE